MRNLPGRRLILEAAIAAAITWLLVFAFRRNPDAVHGGSTMTAKSVSPARLLLHDALGRDHDILSDPRFVVTTNRLPPYLRMPFSGMSHAERLQLRIRWKFDLPRPQNTSFSPSGPGPCSIHGLLMQCTEVTGVRFVIAKEVAGGSVRFGHTNTLNGAQWAEAFTDALRTNHPDWWDAGRKGFRREDLVLLTREGESVLVIPQNMAEEFREKGFKDFRWSLK